MSWGSHLWSAGAICSKTITYQFFLLPVKSIGNETSIRDSSFDNESNIIANKRTNFANLTHAHFHCSNSYFAKEL